MSSNKRKMADAFASPGAAKNANPKPSLTPNNQTMVNESSLNQSMGSLFRSPSVKKCRTIVLNGNRKKSKWFNDPIHGNICMDELCTKIIDTEEFQRLRSLKQLGVCEYVYPGCTHTRFEHSLGVAYLAEQMVEHLRTTQPDLGITDEDVLCVKISGLCHDLGHGPFSHVFDGVFMKRVRPNSTWRHEDASIMMFDSLLRENEIDVSRFNLTELDLEFIREVIRGTKESERRGRPFHKFYLYDIVNNSRSGLDVDKLDYFQRDMKYSNTSTNCSQFERITLNSLVYETTVLEDRDVMKKYPGRNPVMICYPEKMLRECFSLFALRFSLHQTVYTHKTVKKVELMITDVLALADPIVRIQGTKTSNHPDGLYKISECYEDPKAYLDLQDDILNVIKRTPDPQLDEARRILERIRKRHFYQCLGKKLYTRESRLFRESTDDIKRQLVNIAVNKEYLTDEETHNLDDEEDFIIQSQDSCAWNGTRSQQELTEIFSEDDLIVEKMNIHHGMKEKNPIENMRFFSKDMPDSNLAFKMDEELYSTILPRSFEYLAVRVFCRDDRKANTAKKAFEYWLKINKDH